MFIMAFWSFRHFKKDHFSGLTGSKENIVNMGTRILLASPHMSAEGYELEYIHDAFSKNWIAPLGEKCKRI